MPASPNNATVLSMAEMLFRHRIKVVLIPTLVLGVGLAIALFAPRQYKSEAKLALQMGRQSVNLDPTAQTGQQIIGIQQLGRDAEVITALDLIKSRGVISKVVEKLGADYILRGGPEAEADDQPADVVASFIDSTIGAAANRAITTLKSIDPISRDEEAVIEIERNLVADSERDSTLLLVSYSTDTPVGAKTILETLIDVYRNEHLRINRNQDSREFFQEQEGLIREQLNAAMDRVRQAKDEIGVASVDTRRQNLENQLQAITMSAFEAESDRNALVAELKDLNLQLDSLPERLIASKKSIPNQGADLLREQLYTLQVKQADLKARYSSSHPLVVAISQQINEAEKVVDGQSDVREETTDDVNPLHLELALAANQKRSQLASLEAKLESLRDQDKTVRADLEKLNADAMRIALLEREEADLSRKHTRYVDNLEQTRIDQELEEQAVSSISTAQAPTLSEKPVSPSKLIVALGSIVLAFAGTAATVLGLEQISDKIRDERTIEKVTGVPVLATIPDSSAHGRVLVS
ncbi:GumC family protein [Botrimarina mediterranea]|uniref:Chain length determinant protein n=1 Tax=Botrimarina mediterranea TaxID=2528022 RepID=A0A518K6E8_9BACT|nr:Wzz/FepE/Etk N-terminal domain-containing protein [Botrimarina mediterranea]QDV73372.1 Chain length determinant protein [Botrimarina mediterranea]QDV77889.1 Chain length determinant protein [Planctomycetes bacterium K2D]